MTSILAPPEIGILPSAAKQPSQPGCSTALGEMLDTFRERDIRNFLFTEEAIEQPYFANASFPNSAITATLSSKRCCREVVEHVQGYMVYIPAFNIASRSLGFGYHYHYSEDLTLRERAAARFVHDEANGTFTTVLQGEEERVVVTYKQYLSARCHKRYTAWFERAELQRALQEESLMPENFTVCMKQLLVGVEFRDCPYCGRRDCWCTVVFRRARHPFDDTAFREGLEMLMGRFRGVARVESYAGGRVVQVEKVGCEISVCRVENEGVTERLRSWATRAVDVEDVWMRDEDGALKLEDVTRDVGRKEDGVVSELKAALRRERNRASARKSNMKKKLLNDGLKAAVREERKRLERLRGRELVLRRRNLELRRLLAAAEAGGGEGAKPMLGGVKP